MNELAVETFIGHIICKRIRSASSFVLIMNHNYSVNGRERECSYIRTSLCKLLMKLRCGGNEHNNIFLMRNSFVNEKIFFFSLFKSLRSSQVRVNMHVNISTFCLDSWYKPSHYRADRSFDSDFSFLNEESIKLIKYSTQPLICQHFNLAHSFRLLKR